MSVHDMTVESLRMNPNRASVWLVRYAKGPHRVGNITTFRRDVAEQVLARTTAEASAAGMPAPLLYRLDLAAVVLEAGDGVATLPVGRVRDTSGDAECVGSREGSREGSPVEGLPVAPAEPPADPARFAPRAPADTP